MTKQERIDREEVLQLQTAAIAATHRLAAAMERVADATEAQAAVASPAFATKLAQASVVTK